MTVITRVLASVVLMSIAFVEGQARAGQPHTALGPPRPTRAQVDEALARNSAREAAIRETLATNAREIWRTGTVWLDDYLTFMPRVLTSTSNAEIAARRQQYAAAVEKYKAGRVGEALTDFGELAKWAADSLKNVVKPPTDPKALAGRLGNLYDNLKDNSKLYKPWLDADARHSSLIEELGQTRQDRQRLTDLRASLPNPPPRRRAVPKPPPDEPPVDTPLDTTWPSVRADLAKLADELCYPDEGDRCFDGRPDDLKAFLGSHPTYRTAHEAAFQAPSPAVGPGATEAAKLQAAAALIAERSFVRAEIDSARAAMRNQGDIGDRCLASCRDDGTLTGGLSCKIACLKADEAAMQPLRDRWEALLDRESAIGLQIQRLKCYEFSNGRVECFK